MKYLGQKGAMCPAHFLEITASYASSSVALRPAIIAVLPGAWFNNSVWSRMQWKGLCLGSSRLPSSAWETQSGSSCLIISKGAAPLGSEALWLCLLASSRRRTGDVQIISRWQEEDALLLLTLLYLCSFRPIEEKMLRYISFYFKLEEKCFSSADLVLFCWYSMRQKQNPNGWCEMCVCSML